MPSSRGSSQPRNLHIEFFGFSFCFFSKFWNFYNVVLVSSIWWLIFRARAMSRKCLNSWFYASLAKMPLTFSMTVLYCSSEPHSTCLQWIKWVPGWPYFLWIPFWIYLCVAVHWLFTETVSDFCWLKTEKTVEHVLKSFIFSHNESPSLELYFWTTLSDSLLFSIFVFLVFHQAYLFFLFWGSNNALTFRKHMATCDRINLWSRKLIEKGEVFK